MPAHDPSQRTYDRDAYRLDESAVKEWLDRNGATLADAMGKALKSATFGRADTPILSISVNLLQQSGAAGSNLSNYAIVGVFEALVAQLTHAGLPQDSGW